MPDESMTPNLELLQRSIDALNAGDIDAAMNLYASDVVWEGRIQSLRVVLP
jgi:ketosteroid isomerase-like protein